MTYCGMLTRLSEGLYLLLLFLKVKGSPSKAPWTHCDPCNSSLASVELTLPSLLYTVIVHDLESILLPNSTSSHYSHTCLLADHEYSLAHVILWDHSKILSPHIRSHCSTARSKPSSHQWFTHSVWQILVTFASWESHYLPLLFRRVGL